MQFGSVLLTSYLMLGLQIAADHLEDPFGHDQADLALDLVCVIFRECHWCTTYHTLASALHCAVLDDVVFPRQGPMTGSCLVRVRPKTQS